MNWMTYGRQGRYTKVLSAEQVAYMKERVVPSEGFDNFEKSFIDHYMGHNNIWHRIELHLLRCGKDTYNDESFAYFHPTPHFNRIFIVRSGVIIIRADNEDIALKKNWIYLLPINQSFTASYGIGTELVYSHFKIQDSTGLDFFREVKGFQYLKSEQSIANKITRNIGCKTIDEYIRWQSAMIHCVYLFMAELIDFSHRRHNVPDRYIKLVQYIHENCHPGLTIQELADRVNSSQSALSKGFQRSMGMSLKKFIHELLIKKAKELLATTDMNVQETAFKLGYKDPYYFQRFFKQNTGETPFHFKKAVQSHNN